MKYGRTQADDGIVELQIALETKREQKMSYVKKNYIDPTAGFLYLLGCFLVHLVLMCMTCVVKWPNLAEAAKADEVWAAHHEAITGGGEGNLGVCTQ